MNRKWLYAFLVALIVIALVVVLQWIDLLQWRPFSVTKVQLASHDKDNAPVGESGPSTSVPRATGTIAIDKEHKENVEKGLEAIFEGLKQMGATEVPPIEYQLKVAVESGDPGTILRAFNEAIYGRFTIMSESIPAIKEYMDHSDPYVRYLAAATLVRVGDQSGIEGLVQFISNDDVVMPNGSDLRIEAARLLGKYRDKRASMALTKLYESTKNGSVLNALASVQSDNPSAKLISEIEGRQSPGFVAFNLGLVGLPKGENFVRAALNDPKVPTNEVIKTKMIAAWALAQNMKDDAALAHLIEAARPAIERKETKGHSYDDSTKALQYLGSVQSPQAVQVLEDALDSQNPVAVQYATVNLLFNQPGGSQKAEQLVIREFETSQRILGTDLAMQIASKSENPQVRAAAQSYAQRTGSDRWRYFGVERADWPIQNWIYDYVVTLNP